MGFSESGGSGLLEGPHRPWGLRPGASDGGPSAVWRSGVRQNGLGIPHRVRVICPQTEEVPRRSRGHLSLEGSHLCHTHLLEDRAVCRGPSLRDQRGRVREWGDVTVAGAPYGGPEQGPPPERSCPALPLPAPAGHPARMGGLGSIWVLESAGLTPPELKPPSPRAHPLLDLSGPLSSPVEPEGDSEGAAVASASKADSTGESGLCPPLPRLVGTCSSSIVKYRHRFPCRPPLFALRIKSASETSLVTFPLMIMAHGYQGMRPSEHFVFLILTMPALLMRNAGSGQLALSAQLSRDSNPGSVCVCVATAGPLDQRSTQALWSPAGL